MTNSVSNKKCILNLGSIKIYIVLLHPFQFVCYLFLKITNVDNSCNRILNFIIWGILLFKGKIYHKDNT